MTSAASYNGIKYTEGLDMEMFIRGVVTLQDGQEYYILEDLGNTRHFIEAEPYKQYNLRAGQVWRCRISKINCTGRIILEPDHPNYKREHAYYFRIVSEPGLSVHESVFVEDIFNNTIKVRVPESLFNNALRPVSLFCRVTDFRKGIPELLFLPS